MVEINSRVELQFQDEKAITMPKDLIIQFEGHQYLKLRPTSPPMVQFIHGGKVPKKGQETSSKFRLASLQNLGRAAPKHHGTKGRAGSSASSCMCLTVLSEKDKKLAPNSG